MSIFNCFADFEGNTMEATMLMIPIAISWEFMQQI